MPATHARRGRPAFVDLDGARLGPPACDIANRPASRYYLVFEERISRDVRRRVARCVMDGYASVAPADVPPRSLLAFMADLMVAKQGVEYATRLRRNRRQRLGHMLDLAEEIASLARRPGVVTPACKVLP